MDDAGVWRYRLPGHANRELDHARIGDGAGNTAKCSRAKAAIRLGEFWSVHKVKDLSSELHVSLAVKGGVLHESKVDVAKRRAACRITRRAADRKLWRRREGRGIEEVPRAALIRWQIWFANQIRTLQRESCEGIIVGGCVIVMGIPDCRESIPFSAHPPSTELANPEAANRWPVPAGRL